MTKESIKLVSIVSPVYRAESTLEALCGETLSVFDSMGLAVEIILVDDGSPDHSWKKIEELSGNDRRIRGLRLSRNFGQHFAITAGIDRAQGDLVGVIDCDLEDHPKYFKNLVEELNEGYDVVFARRQNKKHSFFKRLSSRLFVFVFNQLTGIRHDSSVGTFSLMSRKVANAYREYRESLRVYTLLVYHLGFKRGYVDTEHGERHSGDSSYSLGKLLSLSFHTTIIYTEKPLRALSMLGFFISFFAFLFASYVVATHFLYGGRLAGWTSLIASIYLCTGLIIFSVGVLGLYLGKSFRESLKRPLYHLQDET